MVGLWFAGYLLEVEVGVGEAYRGCLYVVELLC